MKARTRKRVGDSFLYLIYFLAGLFAALPIIWVVSTSIKPRQEIFSYPPKLIPQSPTLENFVYVLRGTPLPQYFLNSLIVALSTTFLVLLLASLAAYGFSRHTFKGKYAILMVIIGTQMIPGVTNIIPLYLIMNKLHLLNTYLALILIYAAINVPFSIWLLKGFFDSIPFSLDESALIDGCSRLKAFWKVILPLSLPGLSAVAIFTFIASWNEFVLALVLISSQARQTLPLGIYMFSNTYQVSYHSISAACLIAVIPIVALFVILQDFFVSGLTKGAVKG